MGKFFILNKKKLFKGKKKLYFNKKKTSKVMLYFK